MVPLHVGSSGNVLAQVPQVSVIPYLKNPSFIIVIWGKTTSYPANMSEKNNLKLVKHTFSNLAGQSNLDEIQNIRVDRRGAASDKCRLTSENSLNLHELVSYFEASAITYLTEHQFIPENVSRITCPT